MLSKCIRWIIIKEIIELRSWLLTVGAVYSHSKAICDRLNNSSLENIIIINLDGYEVILVELKRANGLTEYA
jgi:hypothetical protein